MKTVHELRRELAAIKDKRIPRAEKVLLAQKLLEDIATIEKAAFDFGKSVPLQELREAREFHQELVEHLR